VASGISTGYTLQTSFVHDFSRASAQSSILIEKTTVDAGEINAMSRSTSEVTFESPRPIASNGGINEFDINEQVLKLRFEKILVRHFVAGELKLG
jgi:hypothetical protein